MRTVVQRVRHARVTVEGEVTGAIDTGLLILLGVHSDDGEEQAVYLARKISGLRVFDDEQGRMNRSLLDIGGGALVVSQFTLYGDARKGRRPSYSAAARPEQAEALYERFCAQLAAEGVSPVATGVFQAHMDIELANDGPVTLWLDTVEMMPQKT